MSIAEINVVYSGWGIVAPVFAVFLAGFVLGYRVGQGRNADDDDGP